MGFLTGTETLRFRQVTGTKKRGTWNVASGHKVRFIEDVRSAEFEDLGCPVAGGQVALATAAADSLDEAAALTDEMRSLGAGTPARKRAGEAQLAAFEQAASCVLKISDRMLRDEFLKPALAFVWPPRITDAPVNSFEAANLKRMRDQLRGYAATISSLEERGIVGRLQTATKVTTYGVVALGALYAFMRLRRRPA